MDYEKIFKSLPVLKKRKNPSAALVLGFLFGSVGLFLYFRKIVDLFLPIFAYIAFAVFRSQLLGQGGVIVLFGAVLAGAYGYLRAMYSNEELSRQQSVPAQPPAPAGATAPGTSSCVKPVTPAPAIPFPQSPVQNAANWWDPEAAGSVAPSVQQPAAPPERRWWK
jgi:hypothetical protein